MATTVPVRNRRRRRERLLTTGQVADVFDVDPHTVWTWANAGKIGFIRTLGGHRRYRPSEVFALRKRLTAEVEHIEAVA